MTKLLDDPSLVEQQLEDFKKQWDSVCHQAADKKNRLIVAMEVGLN